jgi:hypothetical protein
MKDINFPESGFTQQFDLEGQIAVQVRHFAQNLNGVVSGPSADIQQILHAERPLRQV